MFVSKVLRIFVLTTLYAVSTASADEINFNRDIRPILSENCYHCHGPDDEAREADLRLDTYDGATESAIEPGDAESSELIARVISGDADSIMPPADSERSLTKQQIQRLRDWIQQGAKYDQHWSFIAPKKPGLPKVENPKDALTPIDHFVRSPLQDKGFEPAARASRETLIRRVTFDLTGLPPTIAEIDAFINDDSDEAYENLIDGLLKREAFGERMAVDWLDAARYSDTYGYQVDRDRYVWPWRDWVVRAFNENKPYDQFITEQLAGDLLPNASQDQIQATTFNRLHPQKVEGGSVPEEFRIEYVADRTQTFGTAILGLTLECCRCHNHKYDPLSQKEYYQLSAFFDNIDEAGLYSYFTASAIPTPALPLPNAAQEKKLSETKSVMDSALAAYQQALAATQKLESPTAYVETLAQPVLKLDFESKPGGKNTSVQGIDGQAVRLTGDDAVGTKVGNFKRFQPFSVSFWMKTPDRKERAVVFHRSRAWTDAASRGYQLLIEDGKLSFSLIHFWPGNAIRIRTLQEIPVGSWVHVSVSNDGSSQANGLRIYTNGKLAPTEIVRDNLTKNITGGGGDNIAIGERFRDNGFKFGLVDDFRVFDVELTALEALCLAKYEHSLPWLTGNLGELEESKQTLVRDHLRRRNNDELKAKRNALLKAREAYFTTMDGVQEIMVMNELPQQRQTYLLNRGAYDARGDKVAPETPTVLPPFPVDAPRNRLGLAKWLTTPEHPLTSRVAANRLWQMCFGRGLVRTPEDFGSQGRLPTHPELLDWLAVDLVENGWDIKRALKQIMMSATYQQSSQHPDEKLATLDPENEWLARFPSYRLSAEMLRDSSLAVGGRLVGKVGGPPVKPYEVEASFKPAKRDKGDGLYRRSLYTYWKRTGPAPMMMALDAAKRDVCRVQRERTSSPLQAFVLLNGPQFVEAARGLAEKLLLQHNDNTDAMVVDAFRQLTARKPTDKEIAILTRLYQQQLKYFSADVNRAKSYLAVGDAKPNDKCNANQLAATTVVVGTLMNYDESVMKR